MTIVLDMLAASAAAAPFDVEAATRAYLDTLQGAARAKCDAYFEGGYWLPLVGRPGQRRWLMARCCASAGRRQWSGWAIARHQAARMAAASALRHPLHPRRRAADAAVDDLHRLLPRASIRPVEPGFRRMGRRIWHRAGRWRWSSTRSSSSSSSRSSAIARSAGGCGARAPIGVLAGDHDHGCAGLHRAVVQQI